MQLVIDPFLLYNLSLVYCITFDIINSEKLTKLMFVATDVQKMQLFKDFTEKRRFLETTENKPVFDIKARCVICSHSLTHYS